MDVDERGRLIGRKVYSATCIRCGIRGGDVEAHNYDEARVAYLELGWSERTPDDRWAWTCPACVEDGAHA